MYNPYSEIFKDAQSITLTEKDLNSNRTSNIGGSFPSKNLLDSCGRYYKFPNWNSLTGFTAVAPLWERLSYVIANQLGINVLKQTLDTKDVTIGDTTYKNVLCTYAPNLYNGVNKTLALNDYAYVKGIKCKDYLSVLRKLTEYSCYADEMLLLDYILGNIDRHYANIEIDLDTDKPIKLFDFGLSMYVTQGMLDRPESIDLDMSAAVTNNDFGSVILFENVSLIDSEVRRKVKLMDLNKIKTEIEPYLNKTQLEYCLLALECRKEVLLNGII